MTKHGLRMVVVAIGLGAMGCKKKAADEIGGAPPAKGSAITAPTGSATTPAIAPPPPAGAPVGGPPSTQAKPVALPSGTVTVAVPVGWTDAAFGAGRMFNDGGMIPSFINITEDCLGSCDKIAANLAGAVDAQIAMHKGAGYTAEVLTPGTLGPDGMAYELKVSKDTQVFFQVFRYLWKPGQEKAIACSSQAMSEALRDVTKQACLGMTFAPTVAPAAGSGSDAALPPPPVTAPPPG